MRFLIDAQLPPALAALLSRLGHDAVHIMHCAPAGTATTDEAIWILAIGEGRVILTKDEDFAERTWRTTTGPSVVWLRVGNCSNKALEQWFTPLLPDILNRLAAGDRLIEVV